MSIRLSNITTPTNISLLTIGVLFIPALHLLGAATRITATADLDSQLTMAE